MSENLEKIVERIFDRVPKRTKPNQKVLKHAKSSKKHKQVPKLKVKKSKMYQKCAKQKKYNKEKDTANEEGMKNKDETMAENPWTDNIKKAVKTWSQENV